MKGRVSARRETKRGKGSGVGRPVRPTRLGGYSLVLAELILFHPAENETAGAESSSVVELTDSLDHARRAEPKSSALASPPLSPPLSYSWLGAVLDSPFPPQLHAEHPDPRILTDLPALVDRRECCSDAVSTEREVGHVDGC